MDGACGDEAAESVADMEQVFGSEMVSGRIGSDIRFEIVHRVRATGSETIYRLLRQCRVLRSAQLKAGHDPAKGTERECGQDELCG
jgi:hypothetical protein